MSFFSRIPDKKTAFGELATADLTPIIQLQFPYNINLSLINEKTNNANAASIDSNRIKISTGAADNRSSSVFSNELLKYHPGQGALVRFTTVYTTGAANSIQLHGIGNADDGFFFGYNGTAFGILRRQGGSAEVRYLIIGTGSSDAEDITITLDNNAETTVTVTASSNITTTVNEIAAFDFSNTGTGWSAHAEGNTVVFTSFDAATHSGTFSLSGASSAAQDSFDQIVAGALSTNTWVAQTAWNKDKMDGTGISGMTLDTTKGNVYQIQYQWLGYGQIRFYIEHDTDGEFELVHTINYANTSAIPSIDDPTLPLCMSVSNAANNSDIIMYSSSWAGFTEGKLNGSPIRRAIFGEQTSVGATELPVLVIHNREVYQGRENRVQVQISFIAVSTSSGNKPVTIRMYENPTLTNASYNDIDTADSVIEFDIAATAVAGGAFQLSVPLQDSDRELIDVSNLRFIIHPGNSFAVTAQQTTGGTASTVDVSINFVELF